MTEPGASDSASEAEIAEPAAPKPRGRRGRRIAAWILGSIGALLLLAILGFVIWSQVGVMAAEPEPVAAVQANPAIEVTDSGTAIVLAPASGATGEGLVFYPGAKVDPWAYAGKLSGIAGQGATVVIVRPWLNLALFDLRPLSTFTDLAPAVESWTVGGHSMGGVRACIVSSDADELLLFAAYCGSDISGSAIPVLSISGSEDGLATPQKIADTRHLLPADAVFVEIEGAGHSSFGDYGPQPGDGTPTISDEDMTAQLTDLVGGFLGAVMVALACIAALVAAVIQRITGLGFVLVLLGPIVLLYGPVEGITIGVLLALVASLSAVPLVWREVDWPRTLWLIWPGVLAAPLAAILVRVLPDAALLLLIAAMAYFALIAGWIPALSKALTGRSGAVTAGAAAGFMHVASGLSGPPLAAYAVGDKWEQRRFAASVQIIFAVFSLVSVLLRGLPQSPVADVWLLIAATVVGIVIGTLLTRFVPTHIARIAMLAIAWAGATVVLVRGILALWT